MNMPVVISQENKTFANLIECINEITDPRKKGMIDYPLSSIIIIAICAMLAGADNFVEVEQYGKERKRWLKEYCYINCGIPSHDTFNRVFSLLLPREFNNCMIKWLNSFKEESEVINIDAKMLESFKSGDSFSILRAWSPTSKTVLNQIKVPYGTNEITTIPKLIDLINISGKIITIDAIGAQKKITKKIIEEGADYLIAIKANQFQFHEDIKLFLDSVINNELAVKYAYSEIHEKDHGRYEIKKCWATESINWLNQKTEWYGLTSIVVIESTVIEKDKTSINRRYFICSLKAEAEKILKVARSHWSIENNLHWHLDVTFNEDKSTTRGIFVTQNLSMLRVIVISILAMLPWNAGFKRKRQTVNRKPSLLKKILNLKGI